MNSEARRVVVTGVGMITPVGTNTDATWDALCRCESGAAPITLVDTSGFSTTFGCEVKDFDPTAFMSKREAKNVDRCVQFAIVAADEAVKDSGLEIDREDPTKFGCVIGTGIGGINELESQYQRFVDRGPSRISPFLIPKMMANAASGVLAIRHGLKGINFTVVTACASATHAMGEGLKIIRRGLADMLVTGGTEATISILGLGGFCSVKALSTRNDDPTRASRPFDKNRDGFVLAEGAGMLVFEELEHAKKRGAKIYAEVTGYGATCDAFHITAPDETANGPARSMAQALAMGGLNPEDVDNLNAHGTSMPYNDKIETRAIKKAFGAHANKLAVSSTKSMVGHTLGASGGIELITTILTINKGVITPTINYETPDPDCDLDYVPNEARETPVRVALSNSLGFGGHNGTLAVKRFGG